MSSIPVSAVSSVVTATSATPGILTIDDTTNFFAGADCWVMCDDGTRLKVRILEIIDGNDLKVAEIAETPNVSSLGYLLPDLSDFVVGVTASLDLDTVTGGLDTIVESVLTGGLGNEITVEVIGDSGVAEGVTVDTDFAARTVVIHFEDGVSTVADVEAALAGNTLVSVATAGTGATVLNAPGDELVPTNLAGGILSRITQPSQTVTVIPAYDKPSEML